MLDNIRFFPSSPTDEQIAYVLKQVTYARIDNWLDTDLATWGWWLQLVLLVFSLWVWWKLVDKKRLIELSFYGFTIMTLVIWLDEVGYELGLWYYPVDLIPVFPPSTAIDYAMLPIIYALAYQYCRTWRTFIAAMVLLSAVFSFIMEPMLVKFGFYVKLNWQYYYGFPVYAALGIALKLLLEKMKQITVKHGG